MLEITPTIRIPIEEFTFTYARSGGPGGQNVNKVSSKVLLRWKPADSPSLPDEVKARFLAQQQSKLTTEGELLITSEKTRDQKKNYDDCLEKLREMILPAAKPPKKRKKTRPTRGSVERRLSEKRRESERKTGRKTWKRDE